MPPMTPEQVTDAFRAFVPDERFRKFVRTLHTTCRAKGRLLAWQDVLWGQFAAAHPGVPAAFDEVAHALCVCPVHLTRMSEDAAPVVYGLLKYPPDEAQAQHDLFPFANVVVYGPDWHEPETGRVVLICAACRRAMEEWKRG